MRRVSGVLSLIWLAASACAAEPQPYPLWDGKESIADYARRTGLEPTKTLDLGGGVTMELVLIPAGKFMMGMPKPESPWIGGLVLGTALLAVLAMVAQVLVRARRERRRVQFSLRWLLLLVLTIGVAQFGGFHCWWAMQAKHTYWRDAFPVHAVTLLKPFYMAKCETTQEQYQQVMGVNRSQFEGATLPVEVVSWDETVAFCRKSSEKTGETVRLPTEAEWEFACRAGTNTTYNTGDKEADLDRAAWYFANSKGTTHAVGQKAANAWSLYDMHGNVWECCEDWRAPYEAAAVVDPHGPTEGLDRVLRGGAWDETSKSCGSAYRPGYCYGPRTAALIGFRVVVAPRTP